MKQWMKWALALLAGAAVLSVSGCATLGLASPFSSGADSYKAAKSALGDGDYAAAFAGAAYAIALDEAHYPSYKLIVKNYEEGMSAIQAELGELANSEDTIQTQIREVELYDDLVDFMDYIDAHGDPAVVTFKKESVTIPIVDYTENLIDARQRGFDVAMAQAQSLLDFEDFEGADETFDIVLDEFTTSDDRDAVKAEIADRFAARGEVYVAELTYDMIEDVNSLITMAETYAETERVQQLRADLNAKALDISLGEAKRLAEGRTIEAYREAIIVAHGAYEFVEDRTEISELRRGWAAEAMKLALADINRVEPRYDGTISGLEPVRTAYIEMLTWIDGWESITGYEDIRDRYAQFIESSKIRVYAVNGGDLSDATITDLLSATRNEVRSLSDKRYWFHTAEELETARKESYGRQRDSDSDFVAALEGLTVGSSSQDAAALGIEYLIRVSAEVAAATTTENTRRQTKSRSGHIGTDGQVEVSPAIFYSPFRAMYDDDPDAFRRALADSDISRMWFDVPVQMTYTSVTVRQPVSYTVVVERCSDGRQIYNNRFSYTHSATGDEVLTHVSADVSEIETYVARDIRSPRTPGGPRSSDIRENFDENFDASAVATAIVRN